MSANHEQARGEITVPLFQKGYNKPPTSFLIYKIDGGLLKFVKEKKSPKARAPRR